MGKSITVKVSRTALIKELEEALSKRENAENNHQKARDKYEKECEAINNKLIAVFKSGKLKINDIEVKVGQRFTNGLEKKKNEKNIAIYFNAIVPDYPEEPKRDYDSYSAKHEANEIRNAIKLLNLSTEELISTSTYRSVVQYL
jgi:hypothetical protein